MSTSTEPIAAPADPAKPTLRTQLVPLALPALAVLAIALVSWPFTTMTPIPGLDYSWVIGLSLAFHDGLDFGRDVVFTYGPLGFLQTPQLVYPWPVRLAFAWGMLVQVALAGTLLWSMRRGFRTWWLAVPLALVLMGILTPDPTTIIGFTGAVAIIAGLPRTPRAATLLAVGLGVMAGIQALGKINVGITLITVLIVAAATASYERRRIAIALGASFLATAGLAWIVTGQSLTAIPDYITGALAITSGYSSGMIAETPGLEWHFWVAGVLFALGAVVAWQVGAALPARSRVGLLLAWAALDFVSFKTAFVRHDAGHPVVLLTNMLGGLTAFAWAARRRDVALLVGLAPALVYVALTNVNPRTIVTPIKHASDFADQVAILADGSRTNEEIAKGRNTLAGSLQISPRIYRLIKDRRTHIDPWDISAAWAYRLPWKPLPVFQSYSAYTTSLDDRNADALNDSDGPERILRRVAAIDARNNVWESPAAMRAMLCNFTMLDEPVDQWEVLGRVPNRCGPAREFATMKARLGQTVRIPSAPAADQGAYVKIDGFGPGLLEKVRKLFYRAVTRSIVLDGREPGARVIADSVGDGLILHVPEGADLGPGAFKLDQGAKTMKLMRGTGTQDGDVTLHFMAFGIHA